LPEANYKRPVARPVYIIAALTDPYSIRPYLEGVDLPARPPPVAPARPDPQREFEYAAPARRPLDPLSITRLSG